MLFWPHVDFVCNSGPHSLKLLLRYLNVSWVGQQSWWKGWKAWCLMRTVCLCSLEKKLSKGALCSLPRRGSTEGGVPIFSSWYAATKHVGMAQSFIRGGSDLKLGNIYLFTKSWSNTITDLLERWLMLPRLSAFKRHLDNDFNLLLLVQPLNGQVFGQDDWIPIELFYSIFPNKKYYLISSYLTSCGSLWLRFFL